MSLEDRIRQQYSARGPDKGLYDSVYSRLVDEEKWSLIKKLLDKYLGPGKSILEIGAGNGSNSIEFKKLGYTSHDLFLNELLPERIAAIRENFPDLKLYEGDACKIGFGRKFDCVFQSTVFTSVLSEVDRKNLADKMWSLVEYGGIILWYDFIYNNPQNPNVRKVDVAEIRRLFPAAVHSEFHKVTLAPPIGRRVGRLYNLFNIPILRSHVVAVLTKK